MALEVASILDQVSPWQEWADTTLDCLNKVLSEMPVSAGYNLMVTIAGRSYVIVSDRTGKLEVSIPDAGLPTIQALAKVQARILVDADAVKHFDPLKPGWDEDMLAKRKLLLEGDITQLTSFHDDIGPYVGKLQAGIEKAGGPSAAVIADARHELANIARRVKDSELESWDQELAAVETEAPTEHGFRSEIQGAWGWVFFSAMSTMTGNMGQGNYTAANSTLDTLTFRLRICKAEGMMPITMMWGPVGGLGMRWKAFASQDQLAAVENSDEVLMTPFEAQTVLHFIVSGASCEWTAASLFDKPTFDFLTNGAMQLAVMKKAPWFKEQVKVDSLKGEGGGLTFKDGESSGAILPMMEETSAGALQLCPGRRVELHSLVNAAHMNGVRGTVIDELSNGKWRVRMDNSQEDKILKSENLRTFFSTALSSNKAVCAYSIAGSWSEWTPQDLSWDPILQCHRLDVEIAEDGLAEFSIALGQAGNKKWKSVSHQWTLGDTKGNYRIKLFLKENGAIKQLDIQRLDDVLPKLIEEATSLSERSTRAVSDRQADVGESDEEKLRRVLRDACPSWTCETIDDALSKFAKVQIHTVSDLLTSLTANRGRLNVRLKLAGEQPFNSDIVQAMRKHAETAG